jgi:Arc/MetJ-type ribon-helix-helix transcriptional regulator
VATVHSLRDKAGDSEKITINLGYVDLGRIDLLVQERFYSNRTDFMRTAIRNQLTTHGQAVSKSIDRRWRPGRRVPLDLVPAALS